jgi:hypothetical protein
MSEEDTKKIGLAELLRALRADLDAAQSGLTSSGKPALLDLKEAEVEIQFIVQREVKAGIGVDVGLFALEAGGKYHNENVHKMTVKLELHPGADASVAGSGSGI